LLLKCLRVLKIGELWDVMDMGTGAGILAIFTALYSSSVNVDAVDINPQAVENAKTNVLRFGLGNIVDVYYSNLFSGVPFKKRFDTILFNQPLTSDSRFAANGSLEMSVFDPGYQTFRRFLQGAHYHLTKGGRLLVGASPNIGNPRLLSKIIRGEGYDSRIVGRNVEPSNQWDSGIEYRLLELREK